MTQVDDLTLRDAVVDGPAHDVEQAIGSHRQGHLERAAKAARHFQPGRVPGGDEHRVRVAPGKSPERADHEILGLAEFDLASGEYIEAPGIQPPGSRTRAEHRFVDALVNDPDLPSGRGP